ncbi:muscle M-line assembly protein unc-89-like [Trichogramma pretiosum]|uniref:muscle M-line assembly protein unc-89-like n=1 Tax=Trichogramma pretiosum TaxID=7493 RepID=UPI0006C97A0B|nr:muscle M-line assembly protein unc-89-like [Trichogramma pretiosum]XP_014234675.1 muscle M-line assembly protein unc-89-like [Trichogramma pretiosum]
MCDQTAIEYLDGDVVWVKLRSYWWPGQVISLEKLPKEIQAEFEKKPIIAAVKFFQEDSFEFVKNFHQIYHYNCTQKEEFIRKGLDKYRVKSKDGSKLMEKFPGDVKTAETLTNGDPNILSQERFMPQKRPNVSDLFGSKPSPQPPTKSRRSANLIGQKSSRDSKYDSGPKKRFSCNPVMNRSSTSGEFSCYVCDFSTNRVNVIIYHLKTHYSENDSKLQTKLVTPQKSKPKTPQAKAKKIVKKNVSQTNDDTPRKPKPATTNSNKRKSVTAEIEKPPKIKKSDPEIREKLLADWNLDSDDDDLCDSPDSENKTKIVQKEDVDEDDKDKELLNESEMLLNETEGFTSLKSPSHESTIDLSQEKESEQNKSEELQKSVTSVVEKTKSSEKSDSNLDKSRELSCFDFNEDDVDDINVSSIRKNSQESGSQAISDNKLELPKDSETKSIIEKTGEIVKKVTEETKVEKIKSPRKKSENELHTDILPSSPTKSPRKKSEGSDQLTEILPTLPVKSPQKKNERNELHTDAVSTSPTKSPRKKVEENDLSTVAAITSLSPSKSPRKKAEGNDLFTETAPTTPVKSPRKKNEANELFTEAVPTTPVKSPRKKNEANELVTEAVVTTPIKSSRKKNDVNELFTDFLLISPAKSPRKKGEGNDLSMDTVATSSSKSPTKKSEGTELQSNTSLISPAKSPKKKIEENDKKDTLPVSPMKSPRKKIEEGDLHSSLPPLGAISPKKTNEGYQLNTDTASTNSNLTVPLHDSKDDLNCLKKVEKNIEDVKSEKPVTDHVMQIITSVSRTPPDLEPKVTLPKKSPEKKPRNLDTATITDKKLVVKAVSSNLIKRDEKKEIPSTLKSNVEKPVAVNAAAPSVQDDKKPKLQSNEVKISTAALSQEQKIILSPSIVKSPVKLSALDTSIKTDSGVVAESKTVTPKREKPRIIENVTLDRPMVFKTRAISSRGNKSADSKKINYIKADTLKMLTNNTLVQDSGVTSISTTPKTFIINQVGAKTSPKTLANARIIEQVESPMKKKKLTHNLGVARTDISSILTTAGKRLSTPVKLQQHQQLPATLTSKSDEASGKALTLQLGTLPKVSSNNSPLRAGVATSTVMKKQVVTSKATSLNVKPTDKYIVKGMMPASSNQFQIIVQTSTSKNQDTVIQRDNKQTVKPVSKNTKIIQHPDGKVIIMSNNDQTVPKKIVQKRFSSDIPLDNVPTLIDNKVLVSEPATGAKFGGQKKIPGIEISNLKQMQMGNPGFKKVVPQQLPAKKDDVMATLNSSPKIAENVARKAVLTPITGSRIKALAASKKTTVSPVASVNKDTPVKKVKPPTTPITPSTPISTVTITVPKQVATELQPKVAPKPKAARATGNKRTATPKRTAKTVTTPAASPMVTPVVAPVVVPAKEVVVQQPPVIVTELQQPKIVSEQQPQIQQQHLQLPAQTFSITLPAVSGDNKETPVIFTDTPVNLGDNNETYVLVTLDEQGRYNPIDNNFIVMGENGTVFDPNSLEQQVYLVDNNPIVDLQQLEEGKGGIAKSSSTIELPAGTSLATDNNQFAVVTEPQDTLTFENISQTNLINKTILQSTIIPPKEPISSSQVLETSLTLNQPIMSPFEIQSNGTTQTSFTVSYVPKSESFETAKQAESVVCMEGQNETNAASTIAQMTISEKSSNDEKIQEPTYVLDQKIITQDSGSTEMCEKMETENIHNSDEAAKDDSKLMTIELPNAKERTDEYEGTQVYPLDNIIKEMSSDLNNEGISFGKNDDLFLKSGDVSDEVNASSYQLINEDEVAASSYIPETPENQDGDQDQDSAISTSSYEILPCDELNIAKSKIINDVPNQEHLTICSETYDHTRDWTSSQVFTQSENDEYQVLQISTQQISDNNQLEENNFHENCEKFP